MGVPRLLCAGHSARSPTAVDGLLDRARRTARLRTPRGEPINVGDADDDPLYRYGFGLHT
jgi:hypothetical protein